MDIDELTSFFKVASPAVAATQFQSLRELLPISEGGGPSKAVCGGVLEALLIKYSAETADESFVTEGPPCNILLYLLPVILAELTLHVREDAPFNPGRRIQMLQYANDHLETFVKKVLRHSIIEEFNRSAREPIERHLEAATALESVEDAFKADDQTRTNVVQLHSAASAIRLAEIKPPLGADMSAMFVAADVADSSDVKLFSRFALSRLVLAAIEGVLLIRTNLQERLMLVSMTAPGRKRDDISEGTVAPRKSFPTITILPGGQTVEGIPITTALPDGRGGYEERLVNRVGIKRDDIGRPTTDRHSIMKDVFKPFYELPTLTLAEAADYEMQFELATAAKDSKKTDDQTKWGGNVTDIGQKKAVDSEDDEEQEKQRRWDDWGDMNPKGAGNKMHNRA